MRKVAALLLLMIWSGAPALAGAARSLEGDPNSVPHTAASRPDSSTNLPIIPSMPQFNATTDDSYRDPYTHSIILPPTPTATPSRHVETNEPPARPIKPNLLMPVLAVLMFLLAAMLPARNLFFTRTKFAQPPQLTAVPTPKPPSKTTNKIEVDPDDLQIRYRPPRPR